MGGALGSAAIDIGTSQVVLIPHEPIGEWSATVDVWSCIADSDWWLSNDGFNGFACLQHPAIFAFIAGQFGISLAHECVITDAVACNGKSTSNKYTASRRRLENMPIMIADLNSAAHRSNGHFKKSR